MNALYHWMLYHALWSSIFQVSSLLEHLILAPLFRSNNFPASHSSCIRLHIRADSPDHDLNLCGTGCYLSPNECSPRASSFWSMFLLPDHFARPSGIGSREWNHSKSDYDMRWAFKAFSIIPFSESPRSDFSTWERNRRENAIRQESVLPIDIEAVFQRRVVSEIFICYMKRNLVLKSKRKTCQVTDVLHFVQI